MPIRHVTQVNLLYILWVTVNPQLTHSVYKCNNAFFQLPSIFPATIFFHNYLAKNKSGQEGGRGGVQRKVNHAKQNTPLKVMQLHTLLHHLQAGLQNFQTDDHSNNEQQFLSQVVLYFH